MRPDQWQKLRQLEEKLADVFIDEANPDTWPKERIDRYKAKRDAAETAMLLARAQSLMQPGGESPDPARAEKQASDVIAKAQERASAAVEQALKRRAQTNATAFSKPGQG
ncbi:MAG: hypothetical protein ACRC1H_15530 [Caldilineaceae bacterium]